MDRRLRRIDRRDDPPSDRRALRDPGERESGEAGDFGHRRREHIAVAERHRIGTARRREADRQQVAPAARRRGRQRQSEPSVGDANARRRGVRLRGSDAHHAALAAAILEKGADRIGEIAAADIVAEDACELAHRATGDRHADRATIGDPDKADDIRPDARDDAAVGIDGLNVDAGSVGAGEHRRISRLASSRGPHGRARRSPSRPRYWRRGASRPRPCSATP